MKIKTMTATFGKLDKARLELKEGLNLIQAPNEGGKSTWAAFWKAMLFGIDTRDRDKKGHIADKNRFQPWSGVPMAGEMTLEWRGRDITIRRGPKGNTPWAAFSAVYTGTEEPVPGLTAASCGELLTGVGREVFERSAFIGSGGDLTVTAAPELEKRIAALVSSGEEDVSFSQTEARLKEWLNRRKVNKSVGLIPKLEGALQQVERDLAQLETVTGAIARLDGERADLERQRAELASEQDIHRRLAQKELNRRFAQAEDELNAAQAKLNALEQETAKLGPIPDKELLKQAQGELQYIKVLDEEIKAGETALTEAEEALAQAQTAAQDPFFSGLTADEAAGRVQADLNRREKALQVAGQMKRQLIAAGLWAAVGLLAGLWIYLPMLTQAVTPPLWIVLAPVPLELLALLVGVLSLAKRSRALTEAADALARYQVSDPNRAEDLARAYRTRCQAVEAATQQVNAIQDTIRDRTAKRDDTHAALLRFVHSFAPQVRDLFGCSAALSRALTLDYDLALERERTAQCRRRRDDLAAQGGRLFDTLEFLIPPERAPQETDRLLNSVTAQLDQLNEALNQARGRQNAMGDPAALAARREELEEALSRRQEEYDALSLAMSALREANTRLQERFSPELNRLAGQYLARLTGDRYQTVTLTRELEGAAARSEDVLPHSVLYLSRGTADQLYLAVRLAVCALCLPEKPPVLLDDALAAFDDQRLALALDLLRELAQSQQVLLFTCQKREGRR